MNKDEFELPSKKKKKDEFELESKRKSFCS